MLFYNYVYFLTNRILEIASSFLAKGQWFIGKIEMVLSSQHIVSNQNTYVLGGEFWWKPIQLLHEHGFG